jgi:hypothetical protein
MTPMLPLCEPPAARTRANEARSASVTAAGWRHVERNAHALKAAAPKLAHSGMDAPFAAAAIRNSR